MLIAQVRLQLVCIYLRVISDTDAKSDSRIAKCLSVSHKNPSASQNQAYLPLCLSIDLSAIMLPPPPSTIMSISIYAYQPSCQSTIMPISHHACPPSLRNYAQQPSWQSAIIPISHPSCQSATMNPLRIITTYLSTCLSAIMPISHHTYQPSDFKAALQEFQHYS